MTISAIALLAITTAILATLPATTKLENRGSTTTTGLAISTEVPHFTDKLRTKRHALGLLINTLSKSFIKRALPNGARASHLLAKAATRISDTIKYPVWHSAKAGFRSLQKTMSNICKLCKTRKQPLFPGTNKKGYEFLGTQQGPFIRGAIKTGQALKRWKWKKFMLEIGAHTSISFAINAIVKATQKGTGAAIRAAKQIMANPTAVIKNMVSTAHMSWQKLQRADPLVATGCTIAIGALVLSTGYKDITDDENNHNKNPTFDKLKKMSDEILYVAQSEHSHETKIEKIDKLRHDIAQELLIQTQDEELLLEFEIATKKIGEDVILEQLQRWDTVLAYKTAHGNTKTIMELKNEALNDDNLDWTVFPLMEEYRNSTIYDKLYVTSKLSKAKLEAQDRLILRTGQFIKDEIMYAWDLHHRDIHFAKPLKNSTWTETYRNLIPSHGECYESHIGRTVNTSRCQEECEIHQTKACNNNTSQQSPCTNLPCNAIVVFPNVALNRAVNCTILHCNHGTVRMSDTVGASLRTVKTPGDSSLLMQLKKPYSISDPTTWIKWIELHRTETFMTALGALTLIAMTTTCCALACIMGRRRQPMRLLEDTPDTTNKPIIKKTILDQETAYKHPDVPSAPPTPPPPPPPTEHKLEIPTQTSPLLQNNLNTVT